MKTLKFYEFNQNNSGGYMDVDNNVAHRVFIEAESQEQAIAKFEPMIENQSSSCPCCGDRWSSYDPDEVELNRLSIKGYPVGVYTHYKDYEKRFAKITEGLRFIEPPKIIKNTYAEEYKGVVAIDTIEQYARFLANQYGYSKPDAIIHYASGDKKEIFKTKI